MVNVSNEILRSSASRGYSPTWATSGDRNPPQSGASYDHQQPRTPHSTAVGWGCRCVESGRKRAFCRRFANRAQQFELRPVVVDDRGQIEAPCGGQCRNRLLGFNRPQLSIPDPVEVQRQRIGRGEHLLPRMLDLLTPVHRPLAGLHNFSRHLVPQPLVLQMRLTVLALPFPPHGTVSHPQIPQFPDGESVKIAAVPEIGKIVVFPAAESGAGVAEKQVRQPRPPLLLADQFQRFGDA